MREFGSQTHLSAKHDDDIHFVMRVFGVIVKKVVLFRIGGLCRWNNEKNSPTHRLTVVVD
jgi:hypothetical protein